MAKVIIRQLNPGELKRMDVESWPVWTKEKSRFEWSYQGDEECYIVEGEFTVETDEGNYSIKPGDFVTFKDGLECVWDIKNPVKKYYNFP